MRYTTGFRKNYVFGPLIRKHNYRTFIKRPEGTIKEQIKIGAQYQWRMLNQPELEPYFLVKRDRIKRSTFMEQELLVHELLLRLQKTRLIKAHYQPDELANDLDRINTIDNAYCSTGVITLYPYSGMRGKLKPGRAWVETYYDIDDMRRMEYDETSTIRRAFTIDKILYVALQKLIKTTPMDVTVNSIRYMMHRMGYGPKYYNPITYKIIFRQLLKPTGRVISDPTPYLGVKALACAALGAHYNPMAYFPSKLADDLDLRLVKPDQHDILLLDNNFNRVDIDHAMASRNQCKEMLLYVEHDQMEMARRKYRPNRIIKIKTQVMLSRIFTPNFLFHFVNP